MSNSIIVVISTQFRENYGAHDWDGRGECPQHWKSKGGDTYFVNASAADIADSQWWVDVERCINHSSEYSAEYIIHQQVVDLIDFREQDFIDFYESCDLRFCRLRSVVLRAESPQLPKRGCRHSSLGAGLYG